jgi:hypothetical protein
VIPIHEDFSLSQGPLAARCSYFVRDEVPWFESPPGDAGKQGNAFHDAAEAWLVTRADVELEPICAANDVTDAEGRRRVRLLFSRWLLWVAERARIGWVPEVTFAYRWTSDSARELGRGLSRDEMRRLRAADERTGTCDVMTWAEDAQGLYLHVLDWKTGHREVDDPNHNLQLRAYGLFAARALGVSRVKVTVVHVSETGVDARSSSVLDAFSLDLVRAELRSILVHPDAEPKPGTHCAEMYCPAAQGCSAYAAARDAALDEVAPPDPRRLPIVREVAAIQGPEHAAAIYDRVRLAKSQIKAIEGALKAYVEQGGGRIPSGYGKDLVLVPKSRETFSKQRLEGAVPPERAEQVLAELRESGALATSSWVELAERKAAS